MSRRTVPRKWVWSVVAENGGDKLKSVTVRPKGDEETALRGILLELSRRALRRMDKKNGVDNGEEGGWQGRLSPSSFVKQTYELIREQEIDIIVSEGGVLPVSPRGYTVFRRHVPWAAECDPEAPQFAQTMATVCASHFEEKLLERDARRWLPWVMLVLAAAGVAASVWAAAMAH